MARRLGDSFTGAVLVGSGITLASLAFGAIACAAVLLAAGLAIGNESRQAAVALAVAGTAAILGLSLSALGFRHAYAADNGALLTGAALALLVNVAAGIVALVFALSFHW